MVFMYSFQKQWLKTNLVQGLFPQKMGGAGKGPFPAPPIFWEKSPGDEDIHEGRYKVK